MDTWEFVFEVISSLIFVGMVVALIYLVVQRIEAKKNEDFEKRDN